MDPVNDLLERREPNLAPALHEPLARESARTCSGMIQLADRTPPSDGSTLTFTRLP